MSRAAASIAAVLPVRQGAAPGAAPHQRILQRHCSCGQHTVAGSECEECSKNKRSALRHFPGVGDSRGGVPPIVNEVLRSSSEPLDRTTGSFMERRFGHDFSHVRVHIGARAAQSAEAMKARAYTVGDHIVVGRDKFAPADQNGKLLIAHELAHVVQNQKRGGADQAGRHLSDPGDASEREAHAAARHVIRGDAFHIGAAPSAAVQRDAEDVAEAFGIGAAIVGGAALVGVGIAALAGAFDKEKPRESSGASLDDPAFRKKWETGLEEGLKKLESAQPQGCRFTDALEVAYDEENWTQVREGGPGGALGGKSYQAKTADAFKATDLLFSRLDRWTCDCRLFGEIALLHAWWTALNDDRAQFNKRFATLTLRAENTTGISRKTVQPDVMASAEIDDPTWESAPVGSKVVWRNDSPYAKPPWSHEHAIKRSMAKSGQPAIYAAQGIATDAPAQAAAGVAAPPSKVLRSTESQIRLEIAKHCLGDFPYAFEITDASIQRLKGERVDDATLKKLERIKGVAVKGMDKFIQQPVITEINGGARIQKTAEIPNPKIEEVVRLIAKHAEKKPPRDDDPDVIKYVQDNIKRDKIEIPT